MRSELTQLEAAEGHASAFHAIGKTVRVHQFMMRSGPGSLFHSDLTGVRLSPRSCASASPIERIRCDPLPAATRHLMENAKVQMQPARRAGSRMKVAAGDRDIAVSQGGLDYRQGSA